MRDFKDLKKRKVRTLSLTDKDSLKTTMECVSISSILSLINQKFGLLLEINSFELTIIQCGVLIEL